MEKGAIIWQETESRNVAAALTSLQETLFQCEEVLEQKNHRKVIDSVTFDFETEEKLQKKLQKKELNFSFEHARMHCKKIATMSIICYLPGDITKIVSKLEKVETITLQKEKDFVKNPKKDGYRGYHIQTLVHGNKTIQEFGLEIQIRTLGMDYWMHMQNQIKPIKKKKEEKKMLLSADEILQMEEQMRKK